MVIRTIIYFVSSAERRILTQERVATRSRIKIRFARDTNNIFCSLYRKLAESVLFFVQKVDFPHTLNFTAIVGENQLSARKTTPTRATFGIQRIRNTFSTFRVK